MLVQDACLGRAAQDHAVGVRLGHGLIGELPSLALRPREERVLILGQLGSLDVSVKALIQLVVAEHRMDAYRFFMQKHPRLTCLSSSIERAHHGIDYIVHELHAL